MVCFFLGLVGVFFLLCVFVCFVGLLLLLVCLLIKKDLQKKHCDSQLLYILKKNSFKHGTCLYPVMQKGTRN